MSTSNFVSLYDTLSTLADEIGDSLVIIDGECSWTYEDLYRESSRVRDYLLSREGSRVLAIETASLFFWAAGVIAVSGANGMFISLPDDEEQESSDLQSALNVSARLSSRGILEEVPAQSSSGSNAPQIHSFAGGSHTGRPFSLLATSGSTGNPKIVMHSQDALFALSRWQRKILPFSARDRFSMLYPLSTVASLRTLVNCIYSRACMARTGRETLSLRDAVESLRKNQDRKSVV